MKIGRKSRDASYVMLANSVILNDSCDADSQRTAYSPPQRPARPRLKKLKCYLANSSINIPQQWVAVQGRRKMLGCAPKLWRELDNDCAHNMTISELRAEIAQTFHNMEVRNDVYVPPWWNNASPFYTISLKLQAARGRNTFLDVNLSWYITARTFHHSVSVVVINDVHFQPPWKSPHKILMKLSKQRGTQTGYSSKSSHYHVVFTNHVLSRTMSWKKDGELRC